MATERTIHPSLGHAPGSRVRGARRPAAFDAQSVSTSTYLAALAAASDGVMLVDEAGYIGYANPAAEALFSDDSLIGRNFADLSVADRRTICAALRELQRVPRWTGRVSLHRSNTEVDVTVQRVGSEGAPEHYCVVLHGAAPTPEPRTASPSKVQRITSEIAHDFNNQITVILNYTFVLLRHMPADSPLKAHVAEMQAAAWRASQVAQAIHRALVTQPLLPSSNK